MVGSGALSVDWWFVAERLEVDVDDVVEVCVEDSFWLPSVSSCQDVRRGAYFN